jgi:ribosome-associated protein
MWYNCKVKRWILMEKIQIIKDYITLGQLLKLTDFIDSGAQAKVAVKELKILVNGEKEDRRGRKLYPGDTVIIEDSVFEMDVCK